VACFLDHFDEHAYGGVAVRSSKQKFRGELEGERNAGVDSESGKNAQRRAHGIRYVRGIRGARIRGALQCRASRKVTQRNRE